MTYTYPSRIRTRAARLDNGPGLLDIASRPDVREEMRQRVAVGEKPVTALSEPMVEAFGLEPSRNHSLRRLAGEVAAYIVETDYACIRASGSHNINGDLVFGSGQPFRLPGHAKLKLGTDTSTAMDADGTKFLVRHISDEMLAMLENAIVAERERRVST